jgi:hypothetical protein
MFKILSVAAIAVSLAIPASAGVLNGAARPLAPSAPQGAEAGHSQSASQAAKTLALSAETGVSVAEIERFHVILNGYGISNDDADDELKNIVEDEGRMRAGTLSPGFARCWKSRGATADCHPTNSISRLFAVRAAPEVIPAGSSCNAPSGGRRGSARRWRLAAKHSCIGRSTPSRRVTSGS